MKNIAKAVHEDVKSDYNWARARTLTIQGAKALPSGTVHYVTEKFPIVGWLPRYDWRWLINDCIAGLTVGLMLIPQSLSYAKIATIPVEYGLASSWLPGTIYALMGTSKDLSTGPTSLIGLLTSEAIESLGTEEYTPQQIASAMAMCMGIFGIALGFLKLGWLLDFISLPILSGFITAVAITIILGQIDSLLGEDGVGDGTAKTIHDVFHQLPTANGYACAIGFTGIVLLKGIELMGQKWANKSKVVWFITITRAFICLLLFTGVSYGVNKDRDSDDYLFEIAKVQASGIPKPEAPSGGLIGKVASHSIAIFIGAAIEHVGIARAFGVKNNYITDQTQELCYFGVTNLCNSFFHTMGVGGAMSRSAVNSQCRVKSPLCGLVTTAVVLVCIFKLTGALYWIPKATLAAIIITAVWPLISSPKVFYTYWKTSLADFISSMIALWVCLFVSTEYGIAAAVGFNIVYVLLRQIFTPISHDSSSDLSEYSMDPDWQTMIPADIRIFTFNESFLFNNAHRIASSMTDIVQTYHAPSYSSSYGSEAERTWSVVSEKRIAALRKKADIGDPNSLPPIRAVVLDFSRCNHIDCTAVTNLRNFLKELTKYGGESVQARFCGMSHFVRKRFERAGFLLVADEEGEFDQEAAQNGAVVVHCYTNVLQAVQSRADDERVVDWSEKEMVKTEEMHVEQRE